MSNRFIWTLLVGTVLAVMVIGCAGGLPHQLVDQNDHAGLAAWYQQEAVNLRARAEEMRKMAKGYEQRMSKPKQKSVLIEHCRKLVERYTKAAEEAEALAKLHEEEKGS